MCLQIYFHMYEQLESQVMKFLRKLSNNDKCYGVDSNSKDLFYLFILYTIREKKQK